MLGACLVSANLPLLKKQPVFRLKAGSWKSSVTTDQLAAHLYDCLRVRLRSHREKATVQRVVMMVVQRLSSLQHSWERLHEDHCSRLVSAPRSHGLRVCGAARAASRPPGYRPRPLKPPLPPPRNPPPPRGAPRKPPLPPPLPPNLPPPLPPTPPRLTPMPRPRPAPSCMISLALTWAGSQLHARHCSCSEGQCSDSWAGLCALMKSGSLWQASSTGSRAWDVQPV